MSDLAREMHVFPVTTNVTPPWLLPYWRLVRGAARGNLAAAYRTLPKCLPYGVRMPTVQEIAIVLFDHGLIS